MDLMKNIEQILNNEEINKLFIINGYNIIFIDNELYLEDKNKKESKKMSILGDENNKNRIRFKGTNFAFSTNINKEGDFYLDHLLIGNIEQDEYDFIMRREIIDGKNKITIKLVDDKNVKHIYKIKDDSINIDKISIRENKYNIEHFITKKFEEERKDNKLQKYEIEHFHLFKGKENQIIIGNKTQQYVNKFLKEFLILEKTFVGITSYVEKIIPIISASINELSYLNVTPYEIKRTDKEIKNEPEETLLREQTKVYKFTKRKKD